MDHTGDLRTCDRCGRGSEKLKERTVHTAWISQAGRFADPRRHHFRVCPRCLKIWEGGNDLGSTLIFLGLIAFGSWLLNFPAFLWRWPRTAPRGHGALGAELTLGVTAAGILIYASLNLKRWLRSRALDALPAAEAPGWSPQEITAEKYNELIQGAASSLADLGSPAAPVPLDPGRCGICKGELDDTAARVILRTGREIASRVTNRERQGDMLVTTSLKTFGDIEDFEARLCRGCWANRRRRLRRTTIYFTVGFPVLLVAVLIGMITRIENAFLGLGLTALLLVGGLTFFAVTLKRLLGRHPMAFLEKRVTELRNRGRAKSDIIVISTTWPLPRKRYFE